MWGSLRLAPIMQDHRTHESIVTCVFLKGPSTDFSVVDYRAITSVGQVALSRTKTYRFYIDQRFFQAILPVCFSSISEVTRFLLEVQVNISTARPFLFLSFIWVVFPHPNAKGKKQSGHTRLMLDTLSPICTDIRIILYASFTVIRNFPS